MDDELDLVEGVLIPPDASPYEYAISYFFGFLVTNTLFKLRQQTGVTFVGLPRVGKSLAVFLQAGGNAFLSHRADGSSRYTPQYRPGDPKVSHSTVAKTINIQMYRDWQNDRNIWDNPGFNDNRNEAYKVWSYFSLEMAFSLPENISATCVVVNYASSFPDGANARSFQDLAYTLLSSAATDDDQKQAFLDNLCFLLTHVGPMATIAGVVDRLREVHIAYLSLQVNTLGNLARRFPSETRNRVVDFAQKGVRFVTTHWDGTRARQLKGQIDKLRGRIDFGNRQLTDPNVDPLFLDLQRVQASVLLLETMISSSDRIVLSSPDGEAQCQAQRQSLEKAIVSCKPLDRIKLRELAECRRLPNYEVYGILEQLAREMRTTLNTYSDATETFLDSVDDKDSIITSINDDWKAYKALYENELHHRIASIRVRCDRLEGEIEQLKESKTHMIQNMHCATKRKDGWMAWLGLQYLTYAVPTYSRPYDDIVFEGEFGTKEIIQDKGSGVTVVLRSKWRGDIDARVKFMRQECEMEKTQEKIRTKQLLIDQYQSENQRIVSTLTELATVKTRKSLTDIVVSQKMSRQIKDYQRESEKLWKKVPTDIFDDSSGESVELMVSYQEACAGLSKLVEAMQKAKAVPNEMFQTEWPHTMASFLSSYKRYEALAARLQGSVSAALLLSGWKMEDKSNSLRDPDRYDESHTEEPPVCVDTPSSTSADTSTSMESRVVTPSPAADHTKDKCFFRFQKAGDSATIDLMVRELLNLPEGMNGQTLLSVALQKEREKQVGAFRLDASELQKIHSNEAKLVYRMVDGPSLDGSELKQMTEEGLLKLFSRSKQSVVFEVALQTVSRNEMIDFDLL